MNTLFYMQGSGFAQDVMGVTFCLKRPLRKAAGFTLLELLIAGIVAAVVIAAICEVFSSAIRVRDNATERSRETRLQSRATNIIRGDLDNALISGGILASTLQGDSNGSDGDGSFPGYLKLTTTGGKDVISSTAATSGSSPQIYGDVEQVEYYVVRDANNPGQQQSGDLMRVVTRDLMDSTQTAVDQQQILTGVQSLQVEFYDGSQWQTSWMLSGSNAANGGTSGTGGASTGITSGASGTSSTSSTSGTSSSGTTTTLPEAIRVDIQMAPPPGTNQLPPPIQVLVPWVTTPFLSGTNFSIGSDSTSTQ